MSLLPFCRKSRKYGFARAGFRVTNSEAEGADEVGVENSAKVQFCSFLSIESHISYSEPSPNEGAHFVYRKLGRA